MKVSVDYTPFPEQRMIHESLEPHLSGKLVMVIAGRRFGKTLLAIQEIIKRALEMPGSRIWYIAPTKDQAYGIAWRIMIHDRYDKVTKKRIRPYLPPEFIKKAPEHRHYVELNNGSLIEFKGVQDEVFLLGAGLHFAVMDEFPTISYSVWYDTIRPMLLDYNGDVLFIGTVPDPKIHNITLEFIEMYERVLSFPTESDRAFNFSSFSNPHINHAKIESDIKELKRKGREVDANRLYYGKYTREYGVVFPKFNYDTHTVVDFVIPGNWTRLMAVDPHPQKPVDVLWAAVDQRKHYWFYREEEYFRDGRSLTVDETAYEMMAVENKNKEKISMRLIDPTFAKVDLNIVGKKNVKDLYKDLGLVNFREGNRDFMVYYNKFTDMLVEQPEPTVHIFRSCFNLIRQIRNYTWDSWASRKAREEKGTKDKPKKIDDDFIDCMKMIVNSNISPINREQLASFQQHLKQKWEDHNYL